MSRPWSLVSALPSPIISSMRFFLGPDLLERAPDACVAVVVAEGVEHNRGADGVRARLEAAIVATKTRFGEDAELEKAPEIAVWHDHVGRFGIDPRKMAPSIETLIRRTLADDTPHVALVVDLANAIS